MKFEIGERIIVRNHENISCHFVGVSKDEQIIYEYIFANSPNYGLDKAPISDVSKFIPKQKTKDYWRWDLINERSGIIRTEEYLDDDLKRYGGFVAYNDVTWKRKVVGVEPITINIETGDIVE